ncbi:MAG: ParB/RepB/Spo0J family partition protein [Rhizobiales bacterium]|nr:ParB/RepB/Spo0J family partition protein [Hyphomicrobiales bacterium]
MEPGDPNAQAFQRRRLGRGLAALIGEESINTTPAPAADTRGLRTIPIELLRPNPNNPRKSFVESELEDLARSIRDKGLLQPLVVRPRSNGEFEIVAGERRWRAAQRANQHELPAVVRDLSDGEALEIALIENIQRSDLNPLEEARAYQQLIDQFTYTQHQLADAVGKSRSHVSNTLRLLHLPPEVRKYIEDGKLTAGHARTLVAAESPNELADEIIRLGLSVRQAEGLNREKSSRPKTAAAEKDADTRALETELSQKLGLKVEISDKEGSGTVTISYATLEQLDEVSRRLARGNY